MNNCMQCGTQGEDLYDANDFSIIPDHPDERFCASCLSMILDEAFDEFAEEIVNFHSKTGCAPDCYHVVCEKYFGIKQ